MFDRGNLWLYSCDSENYIHKRVKAEGRSGLVFYFVSKIRGDNYKLFFYVRNKKKMTENKTRQNFINARLTIKNKTVTINRISTSHILFISTLNVTDASRFIT